MSVFTITKPESRNGTDGHESVAATPASDSQSDEAAVLLEDLHRKVNLVAEVAAVFLRMLPDPGEPSLERVQDALADVQTSETEAVNPYDRL